MEKLYPQWVGSFKETAHLKLREPKIRVSYEIDYFYKANGEGLN